MLVTIANALQVSIDVLLETMSCPGQPRRTSRPSGAALARHSTTTNCRAVAGELDLDQGVIDLESSGRVNASL